MNPWRHWHADYGPEGPYRGALGYRDFPGSYPYSEAGGGMRQSYRSDYGYGSFERIPSWEQHPWNTQGSTEQRSGLRRMFRRGPKNYKRSDERIREDICERLIYCDMLDTSDVTIEVHDGKATLEGTVPDRRMKHAIEDIVADTAGVEDVENRIRVQRPRLLME